MVTMATAKASSYERYGKDWRALRQLVFAAKGRKCYYCGRHATTIDHLIPRAMGGPHTIDNLVPACARCNYSRGAVFGNRLRARPRVRPRAVTASRQW
jgi:5-methylcytosine-specific restriction endonuclease McrA